MLDLISQPRAADQPFADFRRDHLAAIAAVISGRRPLWSGYDLASRSDLSRTV